MTSGRVRFSPERHFRGGKLRLLQWSCRTTLGRNLLSGKPFLPTWSNVIRMLSGKSCYSEKSRAKAHPYGYYFKKVQHENDLKIKNKPIPENCKLSYILYSETICRPTQS
jgi:hypothetical protein